MINDVLPDSSKEQEPTPNLQNEAVLIVDDDADVLELFKQMIEPTGRNCILANSIDDALSQLRSQKVALVFLDWRLKGKFGSEFLKQCRQIDRLLPVIVMNGDTVRIQDIKTDALLAEADGFLEKPLIAQVVQGLVKRWFERYKASTNTLLPEREEDIKQLEEVKRNYVRHVIGMLKGNISLAAEKLGIHRQTVAALKEEAAPTV